MLKDGFLLTKDVDYTQTYNGTHYNFKFNYTHSTHNIKIIGTEAIPEYTAITILLSFITTTFLAIAVYRRKLSQHRRFSYNLQATRVGGFRGPSEVKNCTQFEVDFLPTYA